jgi:hypothetical protein
MPCYTFIEAILSEDTEGGRQPSFEIFALFILVLELWGAREPRHLDLGLLYADTRLMRDSGGRPGPVGLRLGCCGRWRGHFG